MFTENKKGEKFLHSIFFVWGSKIYVSAPCDSGIVPTIVAVGDWLLGAAAAAGGAEEANERTRSGDLGKPVYPFGLCGPHSSGEYLFSLFLFYYLKYNKLISFQSFAVVYRSSIRHTTT